MSQPLEGKVAVVTGAGQGIGRACAHMLAEQGAAVLLADADAALAAEGAAEIEASGGRAVGFAANLSLAGEAKRLIAATADAFGRIDILVNATSTTGDGASLLDGDEEEWARVHDLNLRAPRLLMREAALRMIEQGEGGKIVSISSSSGSRAAGVRLAYGCSKAALNALTRIAAAQLAPHNINVNAVAPGVTRTKLQKGLRSEDEMQAAVTSGELRNFFGRVSEAEDVAAAVLFLCLPASRQITAQVIHTSAGVVI